MEKRDFVKTVALGSIAAFTPLRLLGLPGFGAKKRSSKNWVWMSWKEDFTLQQWENKFFELKDLGFHGVLLHQGNKEKLEKIVPLAKSADLEIHAWIISLNHPDKELEQAHPEWYTISGEGTSSIQKPPYVPYYKWLCPTKEPVKKFIADWAVNLASIPGLDGIHLDYIRHSDVILPVGLWKKYGIVQDREYPQYDFCYCNDCRQKFKNETGLDPIDLKDPSHNLNWKQFRYDSVTSLVNYVAKEVHGKQKKLSAAVFPTPEIAKKLVRQEWVKWNLDEIFPMIYHSFYEEDVEWIGKATGEGVKALDGRFPLYSGLFVPRLSPKELGQAISISLDNGAKGITIFEEGSLNKHHKRVLKRKLKS